MTIEPAHKTILEYLQKHGSVNTFRLSKHLKIDRIELIDIVEELKNKDLLEFRSGRVSYVAQDKSSLIVSEIENEKPKEIKKEFASKILGNAAPAYNFYLCSGAIIKNLDELLTAFKTMNDHVYRFHANNEKNDFSSWVKDVFEDEELASNIRMKDREEAIGILNDRIDYLKTS